MKRCCPACAAACFVLPLLRSALLFCSPEVYTSNHKTELFDDAYAAVMRRLGATGRQESSYSDLWVWDANKHKWSSSADASKLLARHYKQHWADLVSEAASGEVPLAGWPPAMCASCCLSSLPLGAACDKQQLCLWQPSP